jgi:hypothetical protein
MATNNMDFSSASRYDIYSKLLFIASKYFDVTTEDFLKTGLFGYITESMAMIARDSSFHKTMLYNESFLNTAVMPKSVYNWAKMFGVSIPAATPSYAEIQVTIPIDSLLFQTASAIPNAQKYGSEVVGALSNKQMMILDRGNQFIAGEFRFTLERSILIYKDTEDSEVITVKYCQTEEQTTLLQDISNFFIKTFITSDNYLSFVVRAYQYDVVKRQSQISSSSFLDTKVHRFQFNDQFVGARMKYLKNGVQSPIELRFSNITTPTDSNNRFAYYNLIDTNQLQVTFSSSSGDFIPASNSALLVDIYTTKGAQGNITFTGDVIFRLKEESLKNIPILANFFNESSIGGVNSPSISRIKSTIINEISTRDVIVTETDLNNYFSILTSLLETINDGRVVFVKKRDDILRRVFSAYILMRDGLDLNGAPADSNYTSKVIPTNTITSDFAISSNLSRPFGTIIKKKSGTSNEYEYVPSNALDGSDDYYIVPFFMRVTVDPFRKVKYIYNLTDDSTSLSYKDVSEASAGVYVIPSSVSVRRTLEGANTSPYYIFTASFVTNVSLQNDRTGGSYKLSFFRRGNELTAINGTSLDFQAEDTNLSISSVESEDDKNRFVTTVQFAVDVANDGTEFDFSSEDSSNNYGTFINLSHNGTTVSLPEDVKVQIDFVGVQGNINLKFISDKFLLMFRNLDELMFSDVTLNRVSPRWNPVQNRLVIGTAGTTVPLNSSGSNGDFFLKTDSGDLYQKGVLTSGNWNLFPTALLTQGDKFFSSASGPQGLYEYDSGEKKWAIVATLTSQTTAPTRDTAGSPGAFYMYRFGTPTRYTLYSYDENSYVSSVRIKDIPVVHQSFFTSEANQTKFIRQLFVYIDTLRENLGKLETNTFFDLKFYNTYGDSQYYNTTRTDMELELDVYVFERTDELATAIKDYVRLLVDSANRRSSLRVSSLIKDLTTNFSRYIDHVDFKGLNGTFTQYISEIATVSKNLYAPEYFNISEENLARINVIQLAR